MTKKVTEASEKVIERVPKTKKVIELLLPTSFCGTLILSYKFSYAKCSEISRFFEPLFCGSEKVPQNSRQNPRQIFLRKIKQISRTSFCRSAGRRDVVTSVSARHQSRCCNLPVNKVLCFVGGGGGFGKRSCHVRTASAHRRANISRHSIAKTAC